MALVTGGGAGSVIRPAEAQGIVEQDGDVAGCGGDGCVPAGARREAPVEGSHWDVATPDRNRRPAQQSHRPA